MDSMMGAAAVEALILEALLPLEDLAEAMLC
jgi:hypothetical protein